MTTGKGWLPSRAELLELIRTKLSRAVLWQTVTERIGALKDAKRAGAALNPDREYRTVFHGDLECAILNGAIVEDCQAVYSPNWWSCTIRGIDRSGD